MGASATRVFGLVGLFVVSLIASYLPTASQRIPAIRIPRLAFFLAKHFGTGVILSTAFTHLLSDAYKDLSDVHWLGYKKHWAGLLVMFSIIGIFFVEYISNMYLHRIAHLSGGEPEHKHSLHNEHTHERTPLLSDGSTLDSSQRESMKRKEQVLSVSILQIGIMLHSIVIGLTMGVANDSHFETLLPAILFHQAFEGLALGVRLATISSPDASSPSSHSEEDNEESYDSTLQPRSKTQQYFPPILALLFALPIPFILLVSLFVPSLRTDTNAVLLSVGSPSTWPTHFSSRKPHAVLQGTTSAISAGLLIYVSCVELLAGDFVHHEGMQHSPVRKQLMALAAFMCGAVGMGLIG